MFTKQLANGYTIREITGEEFRPLWDQNAPRIFSDNSLDFMWHQHISESELENLKTLGKHMGDPLRIRLAVFKGDQFVGWSAGDQKSSEIYYMRNSAILPEHRRQGLYSELLKTNIEMLTEKGFQKIYSRHSQTNNAVIIPKLKAGFIITSLELDDMFGTMVHLSYYTNPLRRKMMDFRTGNLRPDEEIKKIFEL